MLAHFYQVIPDVGRQRKGTSKMKKLFICICCGVIGLPSLFQVLCFAAGTNGPHDNASNLELVGSQWRLTKEDSTFGHREYLLIFREAGKLIFAVNVNPPDHDEWEVSGKNVVLRLNRGSSNFKYMGKFINRNHMSGTTTSQNGIAIKWNAYRQERKCFDTSSSKSNLNLEICVEAKAVNEQSAVEPFLSPWKTKARLIHYLAGYSSSSVFGKDWLLERKGKVFKAILRIKNKTTSTQRLPIPLLSDVMIRSKDEEKQAVALCYPNNQLVVEMKGNAMEIDIFPNETVELLYYIPTFRGKATLEIKGLGTSKIVLK